MVKQNYIFIPFAKPFGPSLTGSLTLLLDKRTKSAVLSKFFNSRGKHQFKGLDFHLENP